MTITYKLCNQKIEKGLYETQEEMQMMLDIFFAGERITATEYQGLTSLLGTKHMNEA